MPDIFQLPWPRAGLVENDPLQQQAPGTTTDCLNVRNYDVYDRRNRGGQRSGISKYFPSQINGANIIQGMEALVEAFDPTNVIADTSLLDVDFTTAGSQQDIQDFDSNWTNYEGGAFYDALAGVGAGMGVAPGLGAADQVQTTPHAATLYSTSVSLGSIYILKLTFRVTSSNQFNSVAISFRVATDPTTPNQDFYQFSVESSTQFQLRSRNGGSPTTVGVYAVPTMAVGVDHVMELRMNGDTARMYINDALIATETLGLFTSNTRFGFTSEFAIALSAPARIRRYQAFSGAVPASLRTTKIGIISGGAFYIATPGGIPIAVSNNGANPPDQNLTAGVRVGMQQAFQDIFMCDGASAAYQYYDAGTNTMVDWQDNVTAGTLPAGSVDTTLGCRIIALYRGRIVMSGLSEDPQNWFMSKVNDPFDWDYAPTVTTALDAVAGNNADAGEMGDVITALAPFQDDVMIMGGANTLWIMRGDPANGGAIDNLSRQVGIVGQDAWTWDTAGNLYFFGENGLYRLASGTAQPELVSINKLDKTFEQIDTATNRVSLVYDPRWHGVHIYVSPTSQPTVASRHYFYDERNDSFWPDEYPITTGPTAVLSFFGDNPTDTAVLMGGYDGYIRRFDDTVQDDDGTNISSRVRLSPITPSGVLGSARMDDLHFVLEQQSDPVTMRLWTGDTVEETERLADAAGMPAFARNLSGGRNSTIRNRRSDNAFMVELLQNGKSDGTPGSWAYEDGGGKYQILTRIRGRHVT